MPTGKKDIAKLQAIERQLAIFRQVLEGIGPCLERAMVDVGIEKEKIGAVLERVSELLTKDFLREWDSLNKNASSEGKDNGGLIHKVLSKAGLTG